MKDNDGVAVQVDKEAGASCGGEPAPCCGPPETAGPPDLESIGVTTSSLTTTDRLVHLLARLGVRRNEWRVRPGLYSLGEAGPDSPVFARIVEHRTVIAPQLSATGVAAHEVRERSGFRVLFGPVRAQDIPEFIETGKATEEMRRVRFDLKDRVVLISVEVKGAFPLVAGAAALSYLAGDLIGAAGIASASAAGLAGVPTLLPWLPGEEFSVKGFFLGGLVGLGSAAISLARDDGKGLPLRLLKAASYALALPPITAFLGLMFTGSSTYTSPSGVRREMNTYLPVMVVMSAAGLIMNIAHRLVRAMKG